MHVGRAKAGILNLGAKRTLVFVGVSADNLIAMKVVTGLTRMLGRMFGRKNAPLDRTQLVNLYFTSTNGRDGYSPESQENRTRRNGKYSHLRERA